MSSEMNVNDLVSIDPNKLHAHMNPSRRISIKIPTSSTPSNLNIVAKAVNLNLKVKQAPPQRQVKPDFNQSHRTPSPKFLLHSQTCLNLILKLISISPPTCQLDEHTSRSQPDTSANRMTEIMISLSMYLKLKPCQSQSPPSPVPDKITLQQLQSQS